MNTEFEVKLREKDLFRFNMYQTYLGSSSGAVSILIAVAVFVIGVVSWVNGRQDYGLLYILVSVLLVCYIPFKLKTGAKRNLAKNEMLSKPLHYDINEEEVKVTLGEETASLPWDCVYKMVATASQVLIYSSRVNAYVIPRDQLGDKFETLKAIAEAKLPSFRRKIR